MKLLLTIRNRIETIFNKHAAVFSYILRLLLCFFLLLAVEGNIGYNTLLSQFWFILVFSFVCAFLKMKLIIIVISVYASVQAISLSPGVGILMLVMMLIMCLMHFRMSDNYCLAAALIPLLHIIKLPLAVPLVLAVVSPVTAVIPVICGNIVYFMIHYLNVNNAVITGYADVNEFTRASFYFNGLFTSKEFIYTTLLMIIVFIIVFYMKKLNTAYASEIAVVAGTGVYIIMMIVFNMVFATITFARLRVIIFGSLAALIVALICEKLILPLDSTRTETLEFEDEEYYYFVKAVPKVTLDKETVRVTRISGRKRVTSDRISSKQKKEMSAEEQKQPENKENTIENDENQLN